MSFIEQHTQGKENAGSYILGICLVFLSLIVGQLIAELLANQVFGFSLLQLTQGLDLNVVLTLLLIPFVVVFLTLIFSVAVIHKRPLISLFTTRDRFDWKRFFTGFGVWGLGLVLLHLINFFTGTSIDWNFDPAKFFPLLLISLFLLPIQTATEDLFFRAYLLQGFHKVFKRAGVSMLLSGILFGLMHAGNPEIEVLGYGLLFYYIYTGIFLGVLTHLDDGLEIGMGYHAVNNIFASLVITNDWQAFQTNALWIDHAEPAFGWDSYLTLFLLQPALLYIFHRIYKWKDVREKLMN